MTKDSASHEAPLEAPTKKRRIRRARRKERGKGLLAVLGILVVALLILNVWTYSTYSTEIQNLQSQLDTLTAEYDELINIVSLNKSTILEGFNNRIEDQNEGEYIPHIIKVTYAGYISVNVESSTTTNTYVQVLYSERSVVYDHTVPVGASGTALFPVLPSDNIEVRIGNTNPPSSETVRILFSITYYY